MNKERYNQIIDEEYENYLEKMVYHSEENWLDDGDGKKTYRQLKKQEFINKCKTDSEFSERWGLMIEERELSLEEREKLAVGTVIFLLGSKKDSYDEAGIPTKLITLTYNNEKIENYEY